jgi:DNA replication and repair protein RecF
VLIDDVAAELDEHNLKRVFSKLMTLETQTIVTILNDSVLKQFQQDQQSYKMFHVEHGQIKELE